MKLQILHTRPDRAAPGAQITLSERMWVFGGSDGDSRSPSAVVWEVCKCIKASAEHNGLSGLLADSRTDADHVSSC